MRERERERVNTREKEVGRSYFTINGKKNSFWSSQSNILHNVAMQVKESHSFLSLSLSFFVANLWSNKFQMRFDNISNSMAEPNWELQFPFAWNINSLPKAKKEVVHQWRHNEGLWHNSKFVWRHLWTYQKIFGIFLYQHKASCHKRSIHTELKRKW